MTQYVIAQEIEGGFLYVKSRGQPLVNDQYTPVWTSELVDAERFHYPRGADYNFGGTVYEIVESLGQSFPNTYWPRKKRPTRERTKYEPAPCANNFITDVAHACGLDWNRVFTDVNANGRRCKLWLVYDDGDTEDFKTIVLAALGDHVTFKVTKESYHNTHSLSIYY